MAFHHVAIATRDLAATDRFYREAMGFELAKVVVGPTENPGGWAKHVFYETGGGMIAFWDLHDEQLGDFDPAISTGLGLPQFANHLAFDAPDLDRLETAKARWLEHGHDVVWADHEWCQSIYTTDPNGILVEWCTTTREFTDAERAEALERLRDPAPAQDEAARMKFFRAADAAPAPVGH